MNFLDIRDFGYARGYKVIDDVYSPQVHVYDNNEKYTILFHQNCMDGMVAAWLTERMIKANVMDADVLFVPARYGMMVPDFDPSSHVLIVDFSFDAATLDSIASNVKSLLVIDHHKSALEAVAEEENNNVSWLGVFSDEDKVKISASGMIMQLYQHVFPMQWDKDAADILAMVNTVSRYDTWQHDGALKSPENDLQLFFYNHVHKIYTRECEDFGAKAYDGTFTPDVTMLGNYMLDNWKQKWVDVNGCNCNTALIKGRMFQSLLDKEMETLPAADTFIIDNSDNARDDQIMDAITVLFYGTKVNPRLLPTLSAPDNCQPNTLFVVLTRVSEDDTYTYSTRWRGDEGAKHEVNALWFAKLFGGGGHKGAGGFQTTQTQEQVFSTLIEKVTDAFKLPA